jgi:7-cyano-7-deazaguanine synthase
MPLHNKIGYEYIGRNLFLISVATMVFPFDYGLISSGIRLNSNYKDCSLFFIKLAKQIVEFMSDGTINVDLPFLMSSKKDVIEFCLENSVPLDLTYSCDEGESVPCRHCPSCVELKEAYEEVGIQWRI